MQRKWLEHFCEYRHICEFLGNEGKEKEEIKEYLMQELGLPEAAAYFRIGEHKLRRLINENKNADYLLWNGNRVQIKREKFEKFVDTLEAI